MYNYCLLNNAIRLLLISHSTTTQQQDKHVEADLLICGTWRMPSCQLVIPERFVLNMHVLASPGRPESNKEVK